MTTAPTGMRRFKVKRQFGVGRDFVALGPDDERAYGVDGKVGARPQADVQDASGRVVLTVRGRLLGIPKEMAIFDPEEHEVASLKAKTLSPVRSRMTLRAADGREWQLEGSFMERSYTVTADGRPVIAISQKFLTVRDTYTLDVAQDVDPALALAVLWAVDRWVERD